MTASRAGLMMDLGQRLVCGASSSACAPLELQVSGCNKPDARALSP